MFVNIEKHWPSISLALLFIVLVAIFFLPNAAVPLAGGAVAIGIAGAILLSIRAEIKAQRAGRVHKTLLIWYVLLDVMAILLAISSAFILAGLVTPSVIGPVSVFMETVWPGTGLAAENVAGILAGVLSGLVAVLLVGWVFNFLRKRIGSHLPPVK